LFTFDFLLFFSAHAARASVLIRGLHGRRVAGGRCIHRARADFRTKTTLLVVEPAILKRVAHYALNVAARFAEWNRFDPLVNLCGQARAPRARALWACVICGCDVFYATVLVQLVSKICCAELNVESGFVQ